MSAASRIEANTFKLIVITLLYIVLMLKSCVSDAQTLEEAYYKNPNPKFIGFSGKYGVRALSFKSDIPELNSLNLMQEGGAVSFLYGNDYTKIVLLGAGLYYPVCGSPHTINLVNVAATSNIYVLRSLTRKMRTIEPYTVAGLGYDNYQFRGKYLSVADGPQKASSKGKQPLLGKISASTIRFGAGIEFQLESHLEFLHLFLEAQYSVPFLTNTNQIAFSNTNISSSLLVNVGFSIGIIK